jgi:hypothetical protein
VNAGRRGTHGVAVAADGCRSRCPLASWADTTARGHAQACDGSKVALRIRIMATGGNQPALRTPSPPTHAWTHRRAVGDGSRGRCAVAAHRGGARVGTSGGGACGARHGTKATLRRRWGGWRGSTAPRGSKHATPPLNRRSPLGNWCTQSAPRPSRWRPGTALRRGGWGGGGASMTAAHDGRRRASPLPVHVDSEMPCACVGAGWGGGVKEACTCCSYSLMPLAHRCRAVPAGRAESGRDRGQDAVRPSGTDTCNRTETARV